MLLRCSSSARTTTHGHFWRRSLLYKLATTFTERLPSRAKDIPLCTAGGCEVIKALRGVTLMSETNMRAIARSKYKDYRWDALSQAVGYAPPSCRLEIMCFYICFFRGAFSVRALFKVQCPAVTPKQFKDHRRAPALLKGVQ